MANTYGTWLPGDPRGFRTRHHREHVQGDYKHPPPLGAHDKRHRHAQRLLKRPAVYLSRAARCAAAQAIMHALVHVHQLQLLTLAVSEAHLHLLVRLPERTALHPPTPSSSSSHDEAHTPQRPIHQSQHHYQHRMLRATDPARYYLGIAKERSSKALAQAQLAAPGGVWAARGKVRPIADRMHQLHAFAYILEHINEGAAVWDFRKPDEVLMK